MHYLFTNMGPQQLCAVSLLFLFSCAEGINPFEGGLPRLRCLKGRRIQGCNETLVEAYKKSGLAETDQNFNEPDTWAWLFTRKNKKTPEYLHMCGTKLPSNTKFRSQKNTTVIIHGFLEGICYAAWQREMKDQLLYRSDYNVILIDWTWGNLFDYHDAVANVPVVGKQIAFFLSKLVELGVITAWNIHIIGHSLGAQVAAWLGETFYKLTGHKCRRISGLDPAGPEYYGNTARLEKRHAERVDIIHANAGRCLPNLGYMYPTGHADFYPNGGSVQKSCFPYMLESFIKRDIIYAILCLTPSACFHKHSVQYFKVSINACSCEFIGVKCKSYEDFKAGKCKECGQDGSNCAYMGMDWEEHYKFDGSNDTFYLDTELKCPYCNNSALDLQGFPPLPPSYKPKCFHPS